MDRIARLLARARRPVEPAEMLSSAHVSRTKLATALHRLQEAGAVEARPDGKVRAVAQAGSEMADAVEQAATAEEERLSFNRSRVEMMRSYAEHRSCRRAFVLGYFGEGFEPPCGCCDNCDAGLGSPADDADDAVGLSAGTRVRHEKWGTGTVGQIEDGQVNVVFETVGYRTLALDLVASRGLLERVSDAE